MCRKLFFLIVFAVLLAMSAASQAGLDDDPSLVAWWKFDGDATDSSGNGHHGTLMGGPVFADGIAGQALDTVTDSGGSDYVEITGFDGILGGNPFSIALWIKAAGNGTIMGWGSTAGGTTRFEFRIDDNRLRAESSGNIQGQARVTDGEWHHVAVTVAENSTIGSPGVTIYLDGELDSGIDTNNNALAMEAGFDVTIARRHSGNARWLDALIDDVRLYSRELTPDEIKILAIPPFAYDPVPEDGAATDDTWVGLGWTPSYDAVSHDVYLGTNADDVAARSADAFIGNQTSNSVTLGFPGFLYPEGLPLYTTFYWLVDEVLADGTKQEGSLWSFIVPPLQAYNPIPGDGQYFVDPNVTLSWAPGMRAALHSVYFGDNFDDVNNATGAPPSQNLTFTPDPLELNKQYYWRVDEFDGAATHKGDTWSFTTTLPGLGTAIMERWENIDTTALDALKADWRFPSNPDVNEIVNSFSWNGDDIDNYGARIEGWLYAPNTGDYTFWINTDDNGELWLSTDDDSSNAVLIAEETGWTGFNVWNTGEEQSEPISLIGGQKYYIMALWKEGGGGDHCQVAWQGPGFPELTIIPGSNLSPYEPLTAYNASPLNNAVDVGWTPTLQWNPGIQAAEHDVYFGTDPNAVANATKASPEFKGTKQLGDERYETDNLDLETTYYWRIDEVNAANPESPWIGKVWNFTTANFGVIDDFEIYSGDYPIWESWLDGVGFGVEGTPEYYDGNGTGSAAGDDTVASTAEEGTIYSGTQAMPVWYNNTATATSEIEKTLSPAQDWTVGDLQTLSLRFAGASTNLPGQLYVKVNGVQVDYPGDAANLTLAGWQSWNIDLASFGGGLQNVTRIGIGVQGNGATGKLIFDDIIVYPQPGESITPVQPDPAGLVLHYEFEGNVNDSTGANPGAAFGGPIFLPGKIGQAIMLDGLDDYVAIDNLFYDSNDYTEVSVCAWILTNFEENQVIVAFDRSEYYRLQINGEGGGPGEVGWGVFTLDEGIIDLGSNSRVDDNSWHHVAGVFDNGKLTVYVDGNPQKPAFGGPVFGNTIVRYGYIGLGSESLEFNAEPRTPADYFSGSIDDVRIYHRALTDGEVAGLAGRTSLFDKPF